MTSPQYLIATRKSPLALWQAQHVQALLSQKNIVSELFPVVTSGDKLQHMALRDVGDALAASQNLSGKGLFIKEIQEALLDGRAHIAVHSMKDLPVPQTSGLVLAALLPRAAAEDALVLSPAVLAEAGLGNLSAAEKKALPLAELKKRLLQSPTFCSSPIGTTSLRRQMLLKKHFSPSLNLQILRGNVDSRLKKVRNQEFAAIMLAQAGLERMQWHEAPDIFTMPIDAFICATAQGVIAIEVSADNPTLLNTICSLTSPRTCVQAGVERLVLHLLGGGCHAAVAAHCTARNEVSALFEKNGEVREVRFTLTLEESEVIETLLMQSQNIYSTFFHELCISEVADKIRRELERE